MHPSFLFLLLVPVLRPHSAEAVECAIPSDAKIRLFNSVVEYQANKLPFNPVVSGWIGSTVKFNISAIAVLQKNIFVSFDSRHVVELILTNKQIEKIDDGAFLQLDCVHTLHLDHNNLTELSKDTFQGLFHLQKLYLSDNRLEKLPDLLFMRVARLQLLDLSYNQISSILSMTFQYLNHLETLNLEGNKLSMLPDQVFAPVASLETLNLGWNRLKGVQPERWDGLGKLQTLQLAGNGLDHFDPNSQFHFGWLKALNLSSNFLTMLNVAALHRRLPRLELIDLRNNSWLCEELEDIVQKLSLVKIRFVDDDVKSTSVQGIACAETLSSKRTTETKTERRISMTTEFTLSNKSYIDRIVENTLKDSNAEVKESIRYLQNMVIFLFLILAFFIVFEIFVRTDCCSVIVTRLRGDHNDTENFRLLHR